MTGPQERNGHSPVGQGEPATGQTKYYDPAEVEAYVKNVTNTIKTLQGRLQAAARRAGEAEHLSADRNPESASLGRAMLLAREVADKTIAEADFEAAAVIRAAEEKAASIVAAANDDARRLVEAARNAAADAFEIGEARLLAAVSAFVEGSSVLRAQLGNIEQDATRWRRAGQQPNPTEPSTPVPPVPSAMAPDARVPANPVAGTKSDNGRHPVRTSVDGVGGSRSDVDSLGTSISFSPPQLRPEGKDAGPSGEGT